MKFETEEGYDLTKEYECEEFFYDNEMEIHAWLEHAPPAEVYKYLKDNRQADPYGHLAFSEDSYHPSCDSMLLRRNDPLINTALALFSQNEDVCQFIYSHGDDRFKKFILSGPIAGKLFHGHWFDDEIKLLIKNEKFDHLRCVVKSINTSDYFLADFLKRKGDWSNLSTESWSLLLLYFSRNAKVKSYLPRFPKDDYDYLAMLHAAWALFESIDLERFKNLNRPSVLMSLRVLAINLRFAMLSTPFGRNQVGPSFNASNVCKKWRLLKISDEENQFELESILEILEWLAKLGGSIEFKKEYIRNLRYNDQEDDVVPFTRELERNIVENLESSDENLKEIKSEVWKLETSLRDLWIDLHKHQTVAENSKTRITYSLVVITTLLLYIVFN